MLDTQLVLASLFVQANNKYFSPFSRSHACPQRTHLFWEKYNISMSVLKSYVDRHIVSQSWNRWIYVDFFLRASGFFSLISYQKKPSQGKYVESFNSYLRCFIASHFLFSDVASWLLSSSLSVASASDPPWAATWGENPAVQTQRAGATCGGRTAGQFQW